MNDAFLVGMLHRGADLLEQFQAGSERELVFVGVRRDRYARHVLEREEGTPITRRACVEDGGDSRVLEHRERLAF